MCSKPTELEEVAKEWHSRTREMLKLFKMFYEKHYKRGR